MLHRNLIFMIMDESYGDQFKAELYRKYDACKIFLIPKDQYFIFKQDVNVTASNNQTKVVQT